MDKHTTADARIIAHIPPRNVTGLAEAPIRYEWVGEGVAHVNIFELPDGVDFGDVQGKAFRMGDLRLRAIEVNGWSGVYVMLESHHAAAYAQWRRIVRIADLIYRRCIITLAVWGLADYHAAIIPSWRDIHAARWLRRQWGK